MKSDYFDWNADFLTGIEGIDLQHLKLVETVNELLALNIENKTLDLLKVDKLRKKFYSYVVEHFGDEEKLMDKYYVDERHSDEHKKIHWDFIVKINGFFDDLNLVMEKSKLEEINEFLIDWVTNHILYTDKALVRQLKSIAEYGNTPKQAFEKESRI